MRHERTIGSKGKGLWGMEGEQLPAYIQRVYNDMVEGGSPTGSETYRRAVGIVENWAEGHDGKGHKVSSETQAKAAAAIAEWEKLRAKRHAMTGAKKISEAMTVRSAAVGYLNQDLTADELGDLSVLEAGFDPRRHPRDRAGKWRDIVGKIQALSVGEKVKVSNAFHVHRMAATGDRKYRVTMKSPNPAHPDRQVYVQTAADAADAALGVSPAEADSQVRNIRAGRSQSERRIREAATDAEDAKDGGADEASEDQPSVYCPKCSKKVKPTKDGKCPTCGSDLSKAVAMAKKVSEAVLEAAMTMADRKKLSKKSFAIPERAPASGSYPIHDLEHARAALRLCAGKPEEGRVKAAVYKRYPQLKQGA